jgi:hypothetical protein
VLKVLGVDDPLEPLDLTFEDALVEKQERRQCLVLGRALTRRSVASAP